jgi:hypothetical protein
VALAIKQQLILYSLIIEVVSEEADESELLRGNSPLGYPSDDVFKISANRKSLDEIISVDKF